MGLLKKITAVEPKVPDSCFNTGGILEEPAMKGSFGMQVNYFLPQEQEPLAERWHGSHAGQA